MEGRGALQDMVYIRALAIDFFVSLLNMVDSWVTRTLDEVETWDEMTLEERNTRGMAILAGVLIPSANDSVGLQINRSHSLFASPERGGDIQAKCAECRGRGLHRNRAASRSR